MDYGLRTMRTFSLGLLLPVLGSAILASGCDDLQTDSGDFGVSFPDFVQVPGTSPFPAVESTLLCDAESRCDACESENGDESAAAICAELSLTIDGAVADDNGCYPVELGAPLTFLFTPQMCTEEVAAESLLVEAIPLTQVEGRFNAGFFEIESLTSYIGGASEVFGDPLLARAALAPLQILADHRASLNIHLDDGGSGREVGWNPSRSSLAVDSLAGDPATVENDLPSLYVEASAGARSSATLTLYGQPVSLPDIVAVDEEAIDHIAISAIFSDEGDDGQRPLGLEAHVFDAAGKVIAGVPVAWRIAEGSLELDENYENVGAYAEVNECVPRRRKDQQRAVVEASFGAHAASLEFEWRAYQGPDVYVTEECADDGCGCRTGSPSGGGALLLAMGLLLFRRSGRS